MTPVDDYDGTDHAVLERIADVVFALDHAWRFTYLNGAAERMLQRSRTDLLGCDIWEEFPEAVAV